MAEIFLEPKNINYLHVYILLKLYVQKTGMHLEYIVLSRRSHTL